MIYIVSVKNKLYQSRILGVFDRRSYAEELADEAQSYITSSIEWIEMESYALNIFPNFRQNLLNGVNKDWFDEKD